VQVADWWTRGSSRRQLNSNVGRSSGKGVAECRGRTASSSTVSKGKERLSGWWSDRTPRRGWLSGSLGGSGNDIIGNCDGGWVREVFWYKYLQPLVAAVAVFHQLKYIEVLPPQLPHPPRLIALRPLH